MRDGWAWASFAIGLTLICAVGFVAGHHHAAAGLLVALLVGGVLAALAMRAYRHNRLVAALRQRSRPTVLAGLRVRAGDLGDAAFVAGLGRPTIFCDRRLSDQLSPTQLRAVLLHEHAHQRALDPARLLVVDLVTPLVQRMPLGRRWLTIVIARREIAADRHAISQGATSSDLAAALLVLPPLTHAHVAGFASAVELRLRALLGDLGDLGDLEAPASVRRVVMLLAGSTLGAGVCAWWLHPFLADVTSAIATTVTS